MCLYTRFAEISYQNFQKTYSFLSVLGHAEVMGDVHTHFIVDIYNYLIFHSKAFKSRI